MDRMVTDIEKQIEVRGKFSRRRAFDDNEVVTYVNPRNREYNKKLDRSYGVYTKKIESAMEMGNQKFN